MDVKYVFGFFDVENFYGCYYPVFYVGKLIVGMI